MPRKRASQGEDAQQLPLREKRRKVNGVEEESDLEESLSHMDEPIAKRGLRSSQRSDVPLRLNDHGSPELAQEGLGGSKPTKSHVKFGSESPPPVEEEQLKHQTQEEEAEEEEEESDDDDAPEAISHSHAEAETKAAQAQEAQLLKRREQDERDRRRKRDAQLKAQVKSSDKRRGRAEQAQEESAEETEEPSGKRPKFDMENLPSLLPEELLAIETPVRPTTPPPTAEKSNARKFVDALLGKQDDQMPADVIHQGKKIRVLQTTNRLLPPKSNGGAKNLRESWMQGRATFQKVDRRGSNLSAYRRRPGRQSFV